MRAWPIILAMAILAAVAIFAVGERRESERLSGIASERLQVAESYGKAEELSRVRARHYLGMAEATDRENAPFRSGRAPDVGSWGAQERAQAARFEQDAAHWEALKEKYRRAAAAPSDPVEPDQPGADGPVSLGRFHGRGTSVRS